MNSTGFISSMTLVVSVFLAGCSNQDSSYFSKVVIAQSATKIVTDRELQKANTIALQDYLQQSLKNIYTQPSELQTIRERSLQVPEFTDVATDSSAEVFSETNVQIEGIAERDRMQRIGEHIYLTVGDYQNSQITVWQIDSEDITAEAAETYTLDFNTSGLYKHSTAEKDQILALSMEGYSYFGFDSFFSPFYQNGDNQVASMQRFEAVNGSLTKNGSIEIDGSLVSSRIIDDNLYMVVRYSPYLDLPHYFPENSSQYKSNSAYIEGLEAEDVLPKVRIDGVETNVLASGCYIKSDSEQSYHASSIVLLRVALAEDSLSVDGECYIGETRVVYVSHNAIYLASSVYNDSRLYEGINSIWSSYLETIEIQRFGFEQDGSLEYSGAGQVLGSLGWQTEKAAFHFSEQQGHLSVVTYLYPYTRDLILTNDLSPLDYYVNSSSPSPVIVSILDTDTMQRVAQLPNATHPDPIGKPDEDLFSVRYIGDQLNLVTFSKIDPLYNIDLSSILEPKITGELEITGYSSYLHPVGDNLILGIGKDAIPAADDAWGDGNFAWYQGVQISLFERATDGSLSLLDSKIIGRRGSNTPVENSHHAFSFIEQDTTFTFALPIAVHEEESNYTYQEPASQFYTWSRSELQVYKVDYSQTPTLKLFDSVVAAQLNQTMDDQCCNDSVYFDRSILSGNGVFYIHQNAIIAKIFK